MIAALVLFAVLGILLGFRFGLRELVGSLIFAGVVAAVAAGVQGRGALLILATVAATVLTVQIGFFVGLLGASVWRGATRHRVRPRADPGPSADVVANAPPHDRGSAER
jgi:hypothetical protein